ncbi:MAG: hypothetical protein ACI3VB_07345 [Oscillospiraceae bacterium]
MDMIENQVSAMRQLTEEHFSYSIVASGKKEAATVEWISLNDALEESLAACYGAITGAGLTPEINLPEKDVMRFSDRRAFGRIFGNIISNVLKYSEAI